MTTIPPRDLDGRPYFTDGSGSWTLGTGQPARLNRPTRPTMEAPMPDSTCPTNKRAPDDIVGCGATFTATPDAEGLVDCPECGMWFKADTTADDGIPQRDEIYSKLRDMATTASAVGLPLAEALVAVRAAYGEQGVQA